MLLLTLTSAWVVANAWTSVEVCEHDAINDEEN